MSAMIIHDVRLVGATPLNYNYVMRVGPDHSIDTVLGAVALYGSRHALDALHIFCHGYEDNANLRQQTSTTVTSGGFGLQLCSEGLDLTNASKMARWRGKVKRIVLFACGPADTGAGNAGTEGDGRRLCGEIALWSQAEVIGSSATQYFHRVRASYSGHRVVGNTIDFGAWEQPVFSFSPDNPNGLPINPGNYDMANPTHM